MREIRFRAWDIRRNTMVYEDTYTCDMTIRFNGEVFCYDSYYEIHNKDFILMQYIGLQDHLNIDIYEGDRVSCAGINGVVIYDEADCTFKSKSDGKQLVKYQMLRKTNKAQITIIGNLYNAKLLAVKGRILYYIENSSL